MNLLLDIMTLRFFVTPYLILLIYWLGAFIVPFIAALACWWVAIRLKENKTTAAGINGFSRFLDGLTYARAIRFGLGIIFMLMFLFLELMWRIAFEFLIAFFHIHDALIQLSNKN